MKVQMSAFRLNFVDAQNSGAQMKTAVDIEMLPGDAFRFVWHFSMVSILHEVLSVRCSKLEHIII